MAQSTIYIQEIDQQFIPLFLSPPRTGYEEENIYAKVDDMTYYPVVAPVMGPAGGGGHLQAQQQVAAAAAAGVGQPVVHGLGKPHNIINNMLVALPHSDQVASKTLNIHHHSGGAAAAAAQKQKADAAAAAFNAFGTVHRSQKIYL